MSHKEFAKILESKGCRYVRSGKGSHRIYYSPIIKLEMPIPWHGERGHRRLTLRAGGSASTLEWLWNKYRQIYGLKYISLGREKPPQFGGGNNPFFSYSVNWNTLMIDVTINTPPHGGIYPQGRAAVGLYLGYGIGEVYTEFVQSAVEFTNGGGGLFRLPFRNGFNGHISIALRPPWEFFVL